MNALERCFEANRLLRSMTAKINDAVSGYIYSGEDVGSAVLVYIRQDFRSLQRFWPVQDSELLVQLGKAIDDGRERPLGEAVDSTVPLLGEEFDEYTSSLQMSQSSEVLEGLLHPWIIECSYAHFRNGHHREAVLNAVLALFDKIRERTRLDLDGARLIDTAFSLADPRLVFSNLDTESGQNDQKGFMQILKGVYQGVRNPKAHSLDTDLDEHKAAQYLIFASLLARRLEEAVVAGTPGV